jgi:hypothetical protein
MHDATGYVGSTIALVLADWNKHHDPLFPSTSRPRGHRHRSAAEITRVKFAK